MGFIGLSAVALLLWYTGHEVIDGRLAIGTLTGFLLYGITIGSSLATIASLYGQFREGTGAVTRVLLDASDGDDSWGSIGVSENIIEASWIALVDAVEYKLFKDEGALGATE